MGTGAITTFITAIKKWKTTNCHIYITFKKIAN